MHSYAIVKVLALCLGAVSVVSRTLPEQQSEINARAAGGYGFIDTPTDQDATDVNDLKRRLEGMTHVDRKVLSRDDIEEQICNNPKCDDPKGFSERNSGDCQTLSGNLRNRVGDDDDFQVRPNDILINTNGNCEVGFVNLARGTTSHYSYRALSGVVRALNNLDCGGSVSTRTCVFDDGNFISLAHPDYFNSLIADLGVGVES